MVGHLNTLVPGFNFPPGEILMREYQYIAEGIQKTNDFVSRALTLAGLPTKQRIYQ
jgi:hypothetical protein